MIEHHQGYTTINDTDGIVLDQQANTRLRLFTMHERSNTTSYSSLK